MDAEKTSNLIDMLVDAIFVPPPPPDDADDAPTLDEIRGYAASYLGGEKVEGVCSEGCEGVAPVADAPGFVIEMASGKRFHVTVRELKR